MVGSFHHLKYLWCICCILCCTAVFGQETPPLKTKVPAKVDTGSLPEFRKKAIIVTFSLGFADRQRQMYEVPVGFEKNSIGGFAPVYGRLEYGVSSHVSLGVAFVYGAFQANYSKLYEANGQTYRRNQADMVKIFSGNIFAAYHLGHLIHVKHLDPFIAVGLGNNTISHDNKPQGDSTLSVKEYSFSPFVRAGARYYLSKRGSLFGDIGYDNKALVTIGFSCRFD